MDLAVSPEDINAYVRAALHLQGYDCDEAQVERVITQFNLIRVNAAPCLAVALALEDEPAPVFRP